MLQKLALTLSLVCFWPLAQAGEFRQLQPIPTPQKLPKGAAPVQEPQAVDGAGVKKAVNDLMKAWNTSELASKLGDQFFDKQRLLESMSEKVPRDANVRVLGIQNVQVLQQYLEPGADGKGRTLVSRVSATAQTQIEYRDPQRGFQRVDGVNELIFEVREKRAP